MTQKLLRQSVLRTAQTGNVTPPSSPNRRFPSRRNLVRYGATPSQLGADGTKAQTLQTNNEKVFIRLTDEYPPPYTPPRPME